VRDLLIDRINLRVRLVEIGLTDSALLVPIEAINVVTNDYLFVDREQEPLMRALTLDRYSLD
jgi:hypothetical protein